MAAADPIPKMLETYIDREVLAGAATLVWKDGKVVQSCAVGWRDRETLDLLQDDALFRIASMTKPVVCAAALNLVDEGRIRLTDPVSTWVPEFAGMRVLGSPDGPLDETVAAERDITIEDLLTHRSGLTYSGFHKGPIAAAYDAALGLDIDSHLTPAAWMANLAALPLIDQPGRSFHYSNSVDLLGFLIARIEGTTLGQVLQKRIFGPLGMTDTSFGPPTEDAHRRASLYGFDARGSLMLKPRGAPASGALLADRPADWPFQSGGAGLWSTLADYLAFARLFLGDGSVDGVRILKPETLKAMMTNHLTPDQRERGENFGLPLFSAHGFGYGLAVVMDPERAAITRCKGAMGTVGWPGAYGGWWQADPVNQTVMIFLAQNLLEVDQMAMGIGLEVYDAIIQFHGLASKL
jgi:hypothetical protein